MNENEIQQIYSYINEKINVIFDTFHLFEYALNEQSILNGKKITELELEILKLKEKIEDESNR